MIRFSSIPYLEWPKNVDLRIRRNDVNDQKSPMFYVPADSYSFFSIGDIFQDISTLSDEPYTVLKVKFILDSKYQTISRQVYSLGDMFGQVGGMDSILLNIGSFIVGIFSSKIYMTSLLTYFLIIIFLKII